MDFLKPLEAVLEKIPKGKHVIAAALLCLSLLYLCSLLLSGLKFLQSADARIVGWAFTAIFIVVWLAGTEHLLIRPLRWWLPAIPVFVVMGLFWELLALWPVIAEPDPCGRLSLRWPFLITAGCFAGFALLSLRWPGVTLRIAQIAGAVVGGTFLVYLFPTLWDEWRYGIHPLPHDKIGVWISRFDHDADGKVQGAIVQSLKDALLDAPSAKDVIEILEVPWLITGLTDRDKSERAEDIVQKYGVAIFVYGTTTTGDTYSRIVINDRMGLLLSPRRELQIKGPAFPRTAIRATEAITRFLSSAVYFTWGKCAIAEHKLKPIEPDYTSFRDKPQVLASPVSASDVAWLRAASIVCQVDKGETGADRLSEAAAILRNVIQDGNGVQQLDASAFLGKIYRKLAGVEAPVENLRQAVSVYQLALNRPRPGTWDTELYAAVLMSNLGTAFEDLSQYEDRGGNLERALRYHQKALKGLPPKAPPKLHTLTLNNLGSAYIKASYIDERIKNLKLAIQTYEHSMQVMCPGDAQLLGTVQSNLGDAYLQLAKAQQDSVALNKAISILEDSLSLGKRTLNVELFAETHYKLGEALIESAKDDFDAPNFRRGVASLACSLSTFKGVNSRKAHQVAQRLLQVQSNVAAQYPKPGVLADILRLVPVPEGCSYRAEDLLSVLTYSPTPSNR